MTTLSDILGDWHSFRSRAGHSLQRHLSADWSFWIDDPDFDEGSFSWTCWQRFYSADPRFPISISIPPGVDFFYDRNRADFLLLDAGDTFSLIREDLAMQADKGNQDARAVVHGYKDMHWFMEQKMEQRRRDTNGPYGNQIGVGSFRLHVREQEGLQLGTTGFRVPHVEWSRGDRRRSGKWAYWRDSHRPALWQLGWWFSAEDDESRFRAVLRSFRWLGPEFFASLPAPQEL